jgi:hypothetical protein
MQFNLDIEADEADDVLKDIERTFTFAVADALSARTLGDFFEVLKQRRDEIQADGRSCLSSMAFYRLRRALGGTEARSSLRPATRLAEITGLPARKFFKLLEEGTGLRLPLCGSTWLGEAGGWMVFAGTIGVLPLGLLLGLWAATSMLGLIVVGLWLSSLDPGRMPADCQTLGELSRKVAGLNIARLAKAGARVTDKDMWIGLTQVLSEYSRMPVDKMTPEALLLHR